MDSRIKVTVDRNRWLRGEGELESSLLRTTDGKMCCLGFVAIALGKTEDEIAGRDAPASLTFGAYRDRRAGRAPGEDTRLTIRRPDGNLDSPPCVLEAMTTNDDENINDAERESRLIELLEEINIELTFI